MPGSARITARTRTIAAATLIVAAAALAPALTVLCRIQPAATLVQRAGSAAAPLIPRGYMPEPLRLAPLRSPGHLEISGILSPSRSGAAAGPSPGADTVLGHLFSAVPVAAAWLLVLHTAAVAATLRLYARFGVPPLLATPGESSARALFPGVAAASALLAAPLPALACLLHHLWWGAGASASPTGAAPPVLALGAAGVASIWLGAGLAYLLILSWTVRRRALRAAAAADWGRSHCHQCGYELPSLADRPCPECGRPRRSGPLSNFGLGGRDDPAGPARSRRLARRLATACALAALFAGPLLWPMLGRLVPQRIADGVAAAWSSLL